MVKARFTTLDLRAIVTELRTKVVGLRVGNIYDLDSKTYLFKFAQAEEKVFLLFESGIRIHTTQFERSKSNTPSGFAMKLRKHLRQRRLADIRQLGADRVVDMQFGSGEAAYHVIVELYDKGNIVLTDHELRILSLLRTRTTDEDVRIAVGEQYPVDAARGDPVVDEGALAEALARSEANTTLKKALTASLGFGSSIIEHCVMKAGLEPNAKMPLAGLERGSAGFVALLSALADARALMDAADRVPSKGYIFTGSAKDSEGQSVYESFEPVVLQQDARRTYTEFESFDRAVDEYFGRIEGQRIDVRAAQQEAQASRRIDYLRREHEQRIEGLRRAQDEDYVRGRAIEAAGDLVGRAISVVCGAVAGAMQWQAIAEMVEEAKAARDPVASAIAALHLDSNSITMLLPDPDDTNARPLRVEIDLGMSAHANARRYFDKRRQAAEKERKTVEQSGKAMKSAEQKTRKAAKAAAAAAPATIAKMRKPFWFEKFVWFVSSDNFLVIAGRDMQQNELIVARHLRKGDIYVHADLSGAASCVIKNPQRDGGVPPPRTLQEAGTLAVCCSAAWDAKVVTGAWWVRDDQVSKTPPTGEYLPTGSFMIRGKKNFLAPSQLVLGFGFLFRLGEASVAAHAGERKALDGEAGVAVGPADTAPEAVAELPEAEAASESSSTEGEDGFPDTRVVAAAALPDTEESTEETLDTSANAQEQPEGGPGSAAKRHLSAKERRERRGNKAGGSQDATVKGAKPGPPKAATETSAPRQVRGKKGKMKKMKEKYADQDEEERALRMSLLQSAGAPKNAAQGGAAQPSKGGRTEVAPSKGRHAAASSAVPQGNITEGANVTAASEDVVTPPEGTEGTAPAVEKPAAAGDAADDSDDGDGADDGGDGTQGDLLDTLTGAPREDDELLFAVPVCAPYAAMSSYKFRVKLTPGTTKKGKAAKAALNAFVQNREATARERELMKGVRDTDLFLNIPGKVKVVVPVKGVPGRR